MRPQPSNAPRGVSLERFLADHPHAFTRAELLSRWPRSALDRLLAEGRVVRLLPDAYCGGAHSGDAVTRGEAINLWLPRGLVTGELAISLYCPSWPAPARADVTVTHGTRMREPSWLRVRQDLRQGASATPGGVASVVPARAVLDAWRFAPPTTRRDLLYRALWARVCTWQALAAESARAPRVAGRRELERLLSWFAAGATSPLEVRARRDVFVGARFAELKWQAEVIVGGRRMVADALHRAARVVIEFDGARYHSEAAALAGDRRRDVDLAAAGYVTVRFGWDDVVRQPAWCRERVLAVLNDRLPRPAST